MQRSFSCPSCTTSFQADDASATQQCPSCGSAFSTPQPQQRESDSGGVFIMGALLLVALIVGVILFWSGLLRKPQKRGDGTPPALQSTLCRLRLSGPA